MEPTDVTARRSLAERAREAWQAAQDRVVALRLARARGGDGAPGASAIAKARDEAELAEDRARLAREEAEAAAAAVEAEAERARIRKRRAELLALHADFERAAADLHAGMEAHMAALDRFAEVLVEIGRRERAIDSSWIAGAMTSAANQLGAAWPAHVPAAIGRVIGHRDAAARALWPAEQRRHLEVRLPVPRDPDGDATTEAVA